ncbi:RNA polymerase sigma factor [Salirhabdus euzebyi]|uniref:RNA polymerase sigma factor n=1 Tax=Salirhabdus euzebyi TaxID=394506 RepID=UPI00157B2570|nr:sigma factor [Salirhabdus euzebyi]
MRTAYLLLKDHQNAEEAVQDTFVTAFEKINQLEDPHKLKSWLGIFKCSERSWLRENFQRV